MLFGFFLLASNLFAQQSLPSVSITSSNRRVVVSWLNDYHKPIETILIQRSFDSLKNFRTIGSVLNPLNLENGYLDQQPPYDRRYYRVFIQFPNGEYVIGPSSRFNTSSESIEPLDIRSSIALESTLLSELIYARQKDQLFLSYYHKSIDSPAYAPDSSNAIDKISDGKESHLLSPDAKPIPEKKTTLRTAYPSRFVYTNNNQTIILDFRQTQLQEIRVRFLDEQGYPVLELNELPESLLYLERYNFRKSGWYSFEIYEQGKMVEKSKIYVARDKGIPAEKK